MSRNLLNWLVSSGSLVLVLLTTYSAQAAPVSISTIATLRADLGVQLVNLNQANPLLNLTSQSRNNPIFHALGCSCTACTQGWEQR